MPIRWTSPARRDFRAHLDYLATRSPDAARALGATIREAVERLADYPHRGRPGRRSGTRELVIVGWPYIVVYSVDDARVVILRVLHAAQDWPPQREPQ
jgi:toxin ParE1/3/4